MNCPTPYKDRFDTKGQAKRVVKQMERRGKIGKSRYSPVDAYDCQCGSVHLATRARVKAYR